ncbi:MAG: leucine-rich repeat protein [Roseburia intestinalis]
MRSADALICQKVNIPDTVTIIGEYAFDSCTNLTNVTLSKNLEHMEGRAFGNCEKNNED